MSESDIDSSTRHTANNYITESAAKTWRLQTDPTQEASISAFNIDSTTMHTTEDGTMTTTKTTTELSTTQDVEFTQSNDNEIGGLSDSPMISPSTTFASIMTTATSDSTDFSLAWNEWAPWTECHQRGSDIIRFRILRCFPSADPPQKCPRLLKMPTEFALEYSYLGLYQHSLFLSYTVMSLFDSAYGVEEEACELSVTGLWTEWSVWSVCSSSEGRGTKSRQRNCRAKPCDGVTYENQFCGEELEVATQDGSECFGIIA
jgi:hypothetical protein